MMTIKLNQSNVAFASYMAGDMSIAYAPAVADFVLSVMIWGQMPALSL